MTGPNAEQPRRRSASRHAVLVGLGCLVGAASGCASIEKGAYGVRHVEIEGAEEMGARALATCLLTEARPDFGITVGLEPAGCGEPPFDRDPPRLSLWSWPWTDYQSFNPSVLELDAQRVLRWYRARGFYDAQVVEVRSDPPEAKLPVGEGKPGACDPEKEECTVDVTVVVSEGKPLRVRNVALSGVDGELAQSLGDLRDSLPEPGARFDEFDHDEAKKAIVKRMRELSHAGATVEGKVQLDHQRKAADVEYVVRPGPPYTFGKVNVYGHGVLSATRIAAAADVPTGRPYDESTLREVQEAVYSLGAFSAVDVKRVLREQARRVDVEVTVTPLPKHAGRVGAGIMSGALRRTETGELASVPQWDAHVFGRYEQRHVFDTLGKLHIEERPRIIFQDEFPRLTPPRPGNVLKVVVNQPGLVEARTDLIATGQWDFGPDPYLGFERHDVLARLSGQRAFFRRVLSTTLSVQQDFYIVEQNQTTSDGSELPVGYGYSFVEEDVRVDFRDSRTLTTRGVYLGLLASQAPRWAASDWTAFRLLPEIRGYAPLPLHMVLAGRFALGATLIADADPVCDAAAGVVDDCLDATSRELGPSAYRLRGGGATSNRGFVAGRLGAGLVGGLRRWEAALELRFRLGESFGVTLFGDLGDVNRAAAFRFEETNPSLGFGLRYFTAIGAIRFDVGFRVGPVPADADLLPLIDTPGALHLTIGESF